MWAPSAWEAKVTQEQAQRFEEWQAKLEAWAAQLAAWVAQLEGFSARMGSPSRPILVVDNPATSLEAAE